MRDRHPLIYAARALRDACEALRTGSAPLADWVYNPLSYAWPLHRAFIERYGAGDRRAAVFVGMNPGPWGMLQTGVPFADPHIVREWLGLTGEVTAPAAGKLHPKRPVLGLASTRREVSGTRLYTLARDAYGGLDAFFERFWITNYCPLALFDESGKNVTPAQLPVRALARIHAVCDTHLGRVIRHFRPRWVIGVGRYAESRVRAVAADVDVQIDWIPHPSPASPTANRDWADQVRRRLAEMGL